MKKTVKKVLVLIGIFLFVYLCILYFAVTRNAYNRLVYFSADAAVGNWKSDDDKLLYEFEDERFCVRFYEEDVFSARKNTDFPIWVRNNRDSFPEDSTNMIRYTAVDDILYIYGVTKKEDVQQIKIVDSFLNENLALFNGKRIKSKNALCFCIKVAKDEMKALYSFLAFIDSENNIVSELPESENSELNLLLKPILKSIDKSEQTVNEQYSGVSSSSVSTATSKKFYLVWENEEYFFREFTEIINVKFFEEYAIIQKELTMEEYERVSQKHNLYITAYKMQYDEDLLKLKEYSLSQE